MAINKIFVIRSCCNINMAQQKLIDLGNRKGRLYEQIFGIEKFYSTYLTLLCTVC